MFKCIIVLLWKDKHHPHTLTLKQNIFKQHKLKWNKQIYSEKRNKTHKLIWLNFNYDSKQTTSTPSSIKPVCSRCRHVGGKTEISERSRYLWLWGIFWAPAAGHPEGTDTAPPRGWALCSGWLLMSPSVSAEHSSASQSTAPPSGHCVERKNTGLGSGFGLLTYVFLWFFQKSELLQFHLNTQKQSHTHTADLI